MDDQRGVTADKVALNLVAVVAGAGLGLWLFEPVALALVPGMDPDLRDILGAGFGATVALGLVRSLSP